MDDILANSISATSSGTITRGRRHSLPIEGLPLEQRRRILIAYDGSESSDYALEWTFRNLLCNMKDHLILVSVHNSPVHLIDKETLGLKSNEEIRHSLNKKSKEMSFILDEFANLCHNRNISTQKFILEGDPKKLILDVAERTRSMMIVLAARGISFVQRAIFGSTSTYISQHAKIPVVVVKCESKSSLRTQSEMASSVQWKSLKELAVTQVEIQKTEVLT